MSYLLNAIDSRTHNPLVVSSNLTRPTICEGLVGLRLLTLFYGATLVLLLLFFTKISILHIMDVLGCHIK